MSRRLALLVAGLVAAGCGTYEVRPSAAPAPLAAGSAPAGIVCVARLDDDGTSLAVPVFDNGVLVAAVTRGSRACWHVEPGRHLVTSELLVTAELPIEVGVEAPAWILLEAGRSLRHAGVGSRGYGSGRRRDSVSLARLDTRDVRRVRSSTVLVELSEVPTDQVLPSRAAVRAAR